jgi:hypothetical protein
MQITKLWYYTVPVLLQMLRPPVPLLLRLVGGGQFMKNSLSIIYIINLDENYEWKPIRRLFHTRKARQAYQPASLLGQTPLPLHLYIY